MIMFPTDPFDRFRVEKLAAPSPHLTAEERAFWHSRTPNERLQMMELLRRHTCGKKAATRRMVKVMNIDRLDDQN